MSHLSLPVLKKTKLISKSFLKENTASGTFQAPFPTGVIKSFFSHPLLDKFLKNKFRGLSIQWIELTKGEGVKIHEHSVETMMIACKGSCQLIGDLETIFLEGDTVIIPSYSKHGLYVEEQPFLGLSLRFL